MRTPIQIDHSKDPVDIPEKWVKVLQGLPESGMGFQDVEIEFFNGDAVQGIVLNCSKLITKNPINTADIKDIKTIDCGRVNWMRI